MNAKEYMVKWANYVETKRKMEEVTNKATEGLMPPDLVLKMDDDRFIAKVTPEGNVTIFQPYSVAPGLFGTITLTAAEAITLANWIKETF